MAHAELRRVNRWGSFGKNGDQPLKYRYIYELSDSHLANIITFVRERPFQYGENWLNFLNDEVTYRRAHNIFVPDYPEDRKMTFLR